MKHSDDTKGGESTKSSEDLKSNESSKSRDTVAALLAIALASGIGAEGYFLYQQSREIEMLVRQLGNEAVLPAVPATDDRSHVDLAGPQDEYELGIEDLVVLDRPDRYVVEARLPDVDPSDIRVELDGRRLRISAEERKVITDDTGSTDDVAKESFIAKVEREIALPGPVSASGLTHEFTNGVFTVIVPKHHA
jgi:HSP20 family molecular chaperone IbpA